MNSIQMIQKLFEYHYSLLQRIWESLNDLTEEQYYQDMGYSRGSLHHQIFHTIATDRAWLRGIKGLPRKPGLDIKDFPDRKSLRGLFDDVHTEMLTYVNSLTESEIDRVPERMYGPVWQVLLHVVNHGTDHRAQMLRILHHYDAPTFDQDLILWLWRP